MEGQLSYALKPSLKEMALRRVAVVLWMKPGVFDEIWHSRLERRIFLLAQWYNTCWNVEHSISKLPLPGSIKKQLIPILKDVGLGILKWIMFHEEYFSNLNDYFRVLHKKMCFTAAGAVDYRKTAEELVGCDALDAVERFRLACIYCLESRIPPLWRELPPLYKDKISSQVEAPHLHFLLPSVLEREKPKLSRRQLVFNPNNDFECAALLGHKTLAEYCFQKLTEEERRTSLISTAKLVIKYRSSEWIDSSYHKFLKDETSDVVCYLLSLMTPEEQILIFKELPCEVLMCFLDWPWRDLFLDIADVAWSFLPESKCCLLLSAIRSRFDCYYYFRKFYQNLFLRCPILFRKLLLENEYEAFFIFWSAAEKEDTETIRVIFRDADAADRVRLLSSYRGLHLICFYFDKWPVFEVFLRDSAPSREDKQRLKLAFTQLLLRNGIMEKANGKFRPFFEYVDDVNERAPSIGKTLT